MSRSFLMDEKSTSWPCNEFILQLLSFILSRNYFIFEDANLFLGAWERNVFANDAYALYLQFVLRWYLFIDDLFIVWTGSNTLLNELIQALNHNIDNLYFYI